MSSASAVGQASKNVITLKGSSEIVAEFFGYSINSILYQRGIYPEESFTRVTKYDVGLLVTTDEGLKRYLEQVLRNITTWLETQQIQKLVVVISGVESQEVLERWVFNVENDGAVSSGSGVASKGNKPVEEIRKEIKALIRQIVSSVTFLPLLTEPCTFDLLVYTSKDVDVPQSWEESDPKYVQNSSEVRMRSFTTSLHKVDASVSFKDPDAEEY